MSTPQAPAPLATAAKLHLGQQFLLSLSTRDWALMRTLITDDITWSMPGEGTVSGTAVGAEAVIARSQQIVEYGLNFELLHLLMGQHGLALSLHNTATRGALVLDEYLSTVCQVRDGKISAIDTYLSDLKGFNAFFI